MNAVSATSTSPPGLDDSVNALCQCPQPCPAPCVAPCPDPFTSHPPAPSSSSSSDFCWYHQKHGDQALTLQSYMCLGSGKLADRQDDHALSAGDSNLVFLQDSLTGWRFLVDTGASIFFFCRLLQLHQLLALKPSSLPTVVLLCLVLVLILYLYVLVLVTSPGLSS